MGLTLVLFASGQLARLPTQNYAFLLELVKFLRRVHERQVRSVAPFLLPNLRDRCSCWQRTPFSALARAFAPAVIRSPAGATAAEPGAAQTFVELLLQSSWDPSLPPLAPSPDQGPTPVEQRAPSPTDVVPMEESIDGGVQGGDTVGGWNLSVSGPARRRVDADTDDDASRMTAPDSTAVESFAAVESFKHSPGDSDDGSGIGGGGGERDNDEGGSAGAAPQGPAWSTQVDQEDVISSLEFANRGQQGAWDDLAMDAEMEDVEMEEETA